MPVRCLTCQEPTSLCQCSPEVLAFREAHVIAGDGTNAWINGETLRVLIERALEWGKLKSEPLLQRPEAGSIRRWRDTKVTVPCDGDNVLGYWVPSAPGGNFDCDVVHYYSGRWHEPDNDEDDYRAPDFWMPLPKFPSKEPA